MLAHCQAIQLSLRINSLYTSSSCPCIDSTLGIVVSALFQVGESEAHSDQKGQEREHQSLSRFYQPRHCHHKAEDWRATDLGLGNMDDQLHLPSPLLLYCYLTTCPT